MTGFKHWPVGLKVSTAPAIVGIGAVMLTVLCVVVLHIGEHALEHQRAVHLEGLSLTSDIDRTVQQLNGTLYRSLALEAAGVAESSMRTADSTVVEGVSRLRAMMAKASSIEGDARHGGHDQQHLSFDGIAAFVDSFENAARAAATTRLGDGAAAAASMSRLQVEYQTLADAVEAHMAMQKAHAEQAFDTTMRQTHQLELLALAIIATCLVVAALAAWRVIRHITRPLADAVSIAERLATGDLTPVSVTASRDATGQVLSSIGRVVTHLSSTLSDVSSVASRVDQVAGRIGESSEELQDRTTAQAEAVQRNVAVMQELVRHIQHNASSAKQASEMVDQAASIAGEGGDAFAAMMASMDDLQTSSGQIGDITATIDSIAFQTNILALNAAVEAARAGEHGRGFAIVASEVRTLARQSAEAATEIRDLIATSMCQLDTNVQKARDTSAHMQRVTDSMNGIQEQTRSIAVSSDQQAGEIEGVSETLATMDRLTCENTTLVETAAESARLLRQQSRRLSSAMAAFTIVDTDTAATTRPGG